MNTKIVWFTGLSGSGKTTIADKLCEELTALGKQIMVIDGDVIRMTKHTELSFSPEDIKENNRLIALMCQENMGKYDYILVPIISPFRESRKSARELLQSGFIEVFINTSLEECVLRDVKGLYRKALAGEIENFIGVSENTPYEKPYKPDISIDTISCDVAGSVKKLLEYLGHC
ncbi:MAG: adenylyl-sulfate kinase [Negativicutes bacterium]|nr:adenylyl-sulfate kinase [Negativicutes bacterium]